MRKTLPDTAALVAAGFPSPAEGEIDCGLDLNTLLVHNAAATFFVRARGTALKSAGVNDGDILIVDRARSPRSGDLVLALLNGEFVVRIMKKAEAAVLLLSADPRSRPLTVGSGDSFEIWGVATCVIHRLT